MFIPGLKRIKLNIGIENSFTNKEFAIQSLPDRKIFQYVG